MDLLSVHAFEIHVVVTQSKGEHPMSVEENKAVAKRWIEIWNSQRSEAVDEVLAENYVCYNASDISWSPQSQGLEPVKQGLDKGRAESSTLRLSIHDIIGEGDKVAIRGTFFLKGKPVANHMPRFGPNKATGHRHE